MRRDGDVRRPLVSRMNSQLDELVDGDSGIQSYYLNSADQSGPDPGMQAQDLEDEGQKVLAVLRDVLQGDLRSQELANAAEQVNHWAKMNGMTPEGQGSSNCQIWLRNYLEVIKMSVDNHFPTLPPEGSNGSQPQTVEYLNSALFLAYSEVNRLDPVLNTSGLLSFLIDSYNRRLFDVLDLFIDGCSSVKEAFVLLQWVKQTYFSPDTQDRVLRVSDPLLLIEGFEKSKQKFLTLIQEHISTTLRNILLYSEDPGDCRNEENLIKVHVDVIQCLNAALQASKSISETLSYVNMEKTHLEAQKSNETYPLHLLRIMDTCKHLRSYALKIVDSNNTTDSSTLLMLENMEALVSSIVLQWFAGLAEDHLKKYFKGEDEHIHDLRDMIRNVLAPLPQREGTQKHIVHAAYQSVTRAYLHRLMKRKREQIERIWGDTEAMMMRDAELFHFTFRELSITDDQQKRFLQKMSEIPGCSDVNSLKLICAALYRDFPNESEEHLPALLKWKRGLSRRQIEEILNVSQEACLNGGHIQPRRLHYWRSYLCCA
ncbi:hypothetical protein MHYP_G00015400 [Metynnis hypsauchen]